jgi:NAD(P)-dependent dehydrogenase (short-subunit alcohol dehydrogenase family)
MNPMEGKVCLVTGATDGIGKETAIALAKMGAEIVFTSRNLQKGERVREEIMQLSNNNKVGFFMCDLSSFSSIQSFCTSFKEKHHRLHVLINNAGISGFLRRESKDGIEMTFAVNHLAPFLMTNILLGTILNSAPARIITVSAYLHKFGTIDFEDPEQRISYGIIKSYSQSKLANILFTKQLASELKGRNVTVNCLLPGRAVTNIIQDGGALFNTLVRTMKRINLERFSAARAARTTVYLASSGDVENISGECFRNCAITNTSGASYDMEDAKRLWDVSMGYVKEFL